MGGVLNSNYLRAARVHAAQNIFDLHHQLGFRQIVIRNKFDWRWIIKLLPMMMPVKTENQQLVSLVV